MPADLAYEMPHYHVHHHTPRTRVGKRLRELHMRHHFQDDESGFGVSAPYWDTCRTAPRVRFELRADGAVERRDTASASPVMLSPGERRT